MDEKKLLNEINTIAVVGISQKEDKASNRVSKYMQEKGYRIIPVNPNYDEVLGEKAYKNLKEIPESEGVELVNIFRPSEEVSAIVEETLPLGVKGIWMQEGISDDESKKLAENKGITVIMDKCIMKRHKALFS